MPDTTMDPKAIAQAVAVDAADEAGQVGDFVESIDLGDNVTDFRFETHIRGYEGWQWSVTLYHDIELDHWTVNESSLVPTDRALRPPQWIPWKDRLEPTDLAVTDSIGTDPEDPRMEEGFRKTEPAQENADGTVDGDARDTAEGSAGTEPSSDGAERNPLVEETEDSAPSTISEEDVEEAVEEFDLSRRHVLSHLGRSQTAKRWYEGPRGPKSLSTKASEGNPCSTCGFFIPLKGELNVMFGVCSNKWSPDDGRVVSIDHGCGEHSEIEPPEPSHLWVQSKPAFDDLHIDIIAQVPREERESVELIERLSADESDNPNDEENASDADIEANTIDDEASQEEVSAHTSTQDTPEVESTVDLHADAELPETARPADAEPASEDSIEVRTEDSEGDARKAAKPQSQEEQVAEEDAREERTPEESTDEI